MNGISIGISSLLSSKEKRSWVPGTTDAHMHALQVEWQKKFVYQ
jgi:hypothetical protein